MQTTPRGMRKHVAIFGETNSGKSALFNAILRADAAIVSPVSGTTTDPITKMMELLPYGPIALIDTGGLGDTSRLGEQRVKRTHEMLASVDFALYAIDVSNFHEPTYEEMRAAFDMQLTPHMVVLTKKDIQPIELLALFSKKLKNTYIVSVDDEASITELRERISEALAKQEPPTAGTPAMLVPAGGVAIMVAPIDSEAPAGRLILPQNQFIRACLDGGVRVNCTTPEYLAAVLAESARVDVVVTDSQAFNEVSAIVPPGMPLTSFSIINAHQKGDLAEFVNGIQAIKTLEDGARLLVAEACTHNSSHEDIARVKIPALLRKLTGKSLEFEYRAGRDFPSDLACYAMVIHCGSCNLTRRETLARMRRVAEAGVPITNFGVLLAHGAGIMERAVEPFLV
ncbi:MAG: [FeFe] hydrogenase H-cluster maturation GTPase HydF [Defluviitaleaceae bacterium]|nr:[FeFe] hydrogenase H-cluster maturation GTPase HydF [Defluviitaleaceae bacterium]